MDTATAHGALTISTKQQVDAIAASFSSRGLCVVAQAEAEAEEAREAQTRTDEPLCYRLNDAAVAYYRNGKETMSSDDLLSYIKDTRAMRTREADFSAPTPDDNSVLAGESEKALVPVVRCEGTVGVRQRLAALPSVARALPATVIKTVRVSYPTWFNFQKADTSAEGRRFPLSALAAIVAVAVSLMLIVASAVMITAGEREVDELSLEFQSVAEDVGDLNSDIDVNTDLLRIRDFAVNEFGMVDGKYLSTEYISIEKSETIEVVEEEEENKVSLSTLLSAIGFK